MAQLGVINNENSDSRTILITGVCQVLGRALAIELTKRQHRVIGCSRSIGDLTTLDSELSKIGNKHSLHRVDVTSDSEVRLFARSLVRNCIPDIIVNSAFEVNRTKDVWEISDKEFNAVLFGNVKGAVNICRHFHPAMIGKERGIIVNFTCAWGRFNARMVAPYCISKGAVEGLTKTLSQDLPGEKAVVTVNPGLVQNDVPALDNPALQCKTPQEWAENAADVILGLDRADNGRLIDV